MKCPACDSENVTEGNEVQTFQFGVGVDTPTLVTVTVPVGRCADCKFAWTDDRAEEIRDAATLPLRQ